MGEYDVDMFYRTENKEKLKHNLFKMIKKRHMLSKHILQNEEGDLFIMVEMGSDRLHYGFWRYYDASHHLFEEGNEYATLFEEYYGLLDEQLGEILELVPDDALFFLVSNHGAKGRKGAFGINKWLQEHGFLTLAKEPEVPRRASRTVSEKRE